MPADPSNFNTRVQIPWIIAYLGFFVAVLVGIAPVDAPITWPAVAVGFAMMAGSAGYIVGLNHGAQGGPESLFSEEYLASQSDTTEDLNS